MKTLKLALIILLTATPLSQSAVAKNGVTDDKIRIGMVNVQSGPAAALGKGMLAGASVVFDAANAAGGIHGRRIKLLVADDGYEPDRAIDETLAMIEQENVFSLFGYVGTPTANAVIPIIEETGVPLVGILSGAASLREPITKQIFNIRSSYDDETEAMIRHFVSSGAKTVGVFYQNDGFGKAVLSGAKKALAKRDMPIHVTGTYERNTLAVKTGLVRIMKSPPDALVLVGTYAPVAQFVKNARRAGLKSMMATVSFVGTEALVSAAGPAGSGLLITQVVPYPYSNHIPIVKECRQLIQAKSRSAYDFISLEGCLSAKVMVTALERAGPDLDRKKLIDTLEGMEKVNLGGLDFSYSADTHQALHQIFLTEIHDGMAIEVK